jgi:hypothetical protein
VLPHGISSREHSIKMAADHLHGLEIKGAADAAGLQGPSRSDFSIQGHHHIAGNQRSGFRQFKLEI